MGGRGGERAYHAMWPMIWVTTISSIKRERTEGRRQINYTEKIAPGKYIPGSLRTTFLVRDTINTHQCNYSPAKRTVVYLYLLRLSSLLLQQAGLPRGAVRWVGRQLFSSPTAHRTTVSTWNWKWGFYFNRTCVATRSESAKTLLKIYQVLNISRRINNK